jgi:hypothetical protein
VKTGIKTKKQKTMRTLKLVTIIMFALAVTVTHAQEESSKFSFELNAGPSYAIQNLAETDLDLGVGFEGLLHYKFMPHMGVYAGWGWNKFASDGTFDGIEADFEETGYQFGLQYSHPIRSSGISWFVRAGGLYNHIEVEDPDGEIVGDTGHGLGYHAGTGLEISLGSKWSISPIVKFHSLNRDVEINENNQNLDLKYLSLRVGLTRAF